MKWIVNQKKIIIEIGDITDLDVDVIVNAANSSLLGGGGVDGAIHKRAGFQLLEECRSLKGCPPGEARITKGYNLSASYIIHTVGPVYHDGFHGEDKILASSYRSSLELADQYNLKTIAFPAISTGVYAYPMNKAALISLNTIREFCMGINNLETIRIVLFKEKYYHIYKDILDGINKKRP